MSTICTLAWNDQLRLVFSDVAETAADLYRPAEIEMVNAVALLLDERVRIVLIRGQSVDNVEQRVIMRLPNRLRHLIIFNLERRDHVGF
jgi:hypothetical protein